MRILYLKTFLYIDWYIDISYIFDVSDICDIPGTSYMCDIYDSYIQNICNICHSLICVIYEKHIINKIYILFVIIYQTNQIYNIHDI